MVEKTPEQRAAELRRQVGQLEDRVTELTGEILFADELERVGRQVARLDELEASLGRLRQRDWRWGADLERELAELSERGPVCLSEARSASSEAADQLRPRLDETARVARRLAAEASLAGDEHRIESLERQVKGLEAAVAEARQRLGTVTSPFSRPFDQLARRLDEAHRTLDRFEAGSFDLLPEEHPVAAIEATWKNPPDGDEMEGMLLLTHQRIRFEQREEVVTKRRLLIFAAEKELVQKCWIDEPIGHVGTSEDRTEGLLFKDQLLTLTWSRQVRWQPETTFELEEGKAEQADRLVESILSGEVERDRYTSGDGPARSTRLEWPEDCDDCGARIEPPVKGQTRVECRYCGRSFQVREITD